MLWVMTAELQFDVGLCHELQFDVGLMAGAAVCCRLCALSCSLQKLHVLSYIGCT